MMDLSLVETDNLISELLSRFDAGGIVLLRQRSAKSTDGEFEPFDVIRRWKGLPHTVTGLFMDGAWTVCDDLDEHLDRT